MGGTQRDPTDHCRTTLPHAGETFIDPYSWPGLLSIVLGIISLVGCLAAAAYQHAEWVPTTGLVGLLAVSGGIAWLVLEHHGVLRLESHWRASHPDGQLDRRRILALVPEPAPERTRLSRSTLGNHPVVNHAPLRFGR
jgi:hypothetical protein